MQSYDDRNYSWTKGKLTKIRKGNLLSSVYEDYKFTYDAYGRRVAKDYYYRSKNIAVRDLSYAASGDFSINYSTTYNYDSSGRLIRERCVDSFPNGGGTPSTREFIYLYDENEIIGVMYSYNDSGAEPYYFHKNLQGDVIAIYDASGNIQAEYAYDAYGNCTVINSALYDLATRNPIRYRSYYYDRETELYYLNSRYYNPEWGRFISPDSTNYLDPESVNGLNLYAYCNNDPVNHVDPSGTIALSILIGLLVGATVGACIGFGTVIYTDYLDDGQIFNGSVKWYEYIGGTVTGAVLGAGIGGIIGAGGTVLIKATCSVANKFVADLFAYTLTGTPFGTWEDYAVAFISGGIIEAFHMNNFARAIYDISIRPAINQINICSVSLEGIL